MLLAAAICARPPFFNQPSAGALSEHLDVASRQPVKGRANDTAVRKGIDPSVQSAADNIPPVQGIFDLARRGSRLLLMNQ